MVSAFSRIWVINILLAACCVYFGMMGYEAWSRGEETIPEMQTGKAQEKLPPPKEIVGRTMPPEAVYALVAEKNLFSKSRAEFVPEEKEKAGPLKISDKTIFLYGVVVLGDQKRALISNPESGPSPAKKQAARDKWVALGEKLGNFTVTEIKKDRITLADGANKREILLFDSNKPKRQVAAAEKPPAPAVVTTGPAAAAAPAPTAAKPSAEQPAARVAGEAAAAAGEYKIINTPFGPIKRRIQ